MSNYSKAHEDAISRNANAFIGMMKGLCQPLRILWRSIRCGALPVSQCLLVGSLALLFVRFKLDVAMFKKLHLMMFYPTNGWFRIGYLTGVGLSGVAVWTIYATGMHNGLRRRITEALETSGLKNRLGNCPRVVGEWPIDETIRKLRLTNASLPYADFVRARSGLESGLKIYIDEIREIREQGLIDIIYAKTPIPSLVEWDKEWINKSGLVVGETRSKLIKTNFTETPHLLVAGQTGGGKSTFLRQIITAQYLKDSESNFTLIDLKGGLEFQMFQDLERINVLPDLRSASIELAKFSVTVKTRMALLKREKHKDRDSYLAQCRAKKLKPDSAITSRIIIVIDEAAEMFLAGSHSSARDIQKAREIISQIARQGRAVGMHLIIATQRPDSKALDPQVKANLTGVLCFQMANDASSMIVLGCGRATDLPPISGRALWKSGSQMIEVQVPYMAPEITEELLATFHVSTQSQNKKMVSELGDLI